MTGLPKSKEILSLYNILNTKYYKNKSLESLVFRIFSVSTMNSGCSQSFLVNVDGNKPVLTTQDYEPQKCEIPTCGESLSAKWFVLSREACRLRDIRRDMVARERKQSESPSLRPLWTDSSQLDPLRSLLKNSARQRFDMWSIRDVFVRLHFRFYSWARWKFGRQKKDLTRVIFHFGLEAKRAKRKVWGI